MPFSALAEEFHSAPKTVKAGLDGAGLYARSLSYCGHYLTDGFVHLAWVAEIAKPAVRKKVTAAGLWVEVNGGEHFEYVYGEETYSVKITEPGYFIPDYLHYNPTRKAWLDKGRELSKARSEAGKKGAMVKWERQREKDARDGKTAGKQDGNPMANAWQTDDYQEQEPEQEHLLDNSSGRQVEDESLPIANELLTARLIGAIGDHADQGTKTVVRSYAKQLPESSVAKVLESLTMNDPRDRAAYAVGALKAELSERAIA